jgi:alkylhydroperoxidase/carboxymuconolactone decarboxylase family protein YurZ
MRVKQHVGALNKDAGRFVCKHVESFPDIGKISGPESRYSGSGTGRAAPRFTAGSMQEDTMFRRKEETMTDYLPEVYQHFERRYPAVKEAFDALGAAEHDAGPLAERERRLIKLGIAVGAESEGGVRSHVRKLLGVGVSEEEILHTIVLALTTIGFPATNAALSWAEEVLSEEV